MVTVRWARECEFAIDTPWTQAWAVGVPVSLDMIPLEASFDESTHDVAAL
jgi:hypothetical protein